MKFNCLYNYLVLLSDTMYHYSVFKKFPSKSDWKFVFLNNTLNTKGMLYVPFCVFVIVLVNKDLSYYINMLFLMTIFVNKLGMFDLKMNAKSHCKQIRIDLQTFDKLYKYRWMYLIFSSTFF